MVCHFVPQLSHLNGSAAEAITANRPHAMNTSISAEDAFILEFFNTKQEEEDTRYYEASFMLIAPGVTCSARV